MFFAESEFFSEKVQDLMFEWLWRTDELLTAWNSCAERKKSIKLTWQEDELEPEQLTALQVEDERSLIKQSDLNPVLIYDDVRNKVLTPYFSDIKNEKEASLCWHCIITYRHCFQRSLSISSGNGNKPRQIRGLA